MKRCLSTMLSLPNVTLIALTNLDFEGHKKALDKSCEGITWGAVKLIWDEGITDINEWNRKIVFELHNYVQTEFAMLIHADGYVIDPDMWRDEFLDYDYIGAPWPLPQDDYSYRAANEQIIRVGNSVSIRSKRLMELPSRLGMEWKSYYGNTNEDGYICVHNRHLFTGLGMKFAPIDIARHFSKENEMLENEGIKTFAFHSL